ncbi:MAG TPA: LysE family translocator [Blastocatellia bacterium]|nr:LysE family translocator [Blastocatellia bacterium]
MPEAHGLILFMMATLALNLTPGPDMLYVIARSVGQGRAAGVVSAFGIAAGCLVHMLAVAFGLAGLVMTVPAAYEVIKYAGAAYLIWLGIKQLTDRRELKAAAEIRPDSLKEIFLQGVVTNVLNPKVALFFLAFLPQFVVRTGNVAAQIILLGVLFNISGTIVNVVVAWTAGWLGERFNAREGLAGRFRRLSGVVFIGLGVRLALLERK